MERDRERVGLAHRYGMAVDPGEHRHLGSDAFHPGGSDEDAANRPAVQAVDLDVGLEGVDLPAESVAPNRHIDDAQRLLIHPAIQDGGPQQDHPGAGAEHRQAGGQPFDQRLPELEDIKQTAHGGGFAAGQHDPVDGCEFSRTADGDGGDPETVQGDQVLAHVTLQR